MILKIKQAQHDVLLLCVKCGCPMEGHMGCGGEIPAVYIMPCENCAKKEKGK